MNESPNLLHFVHLDRLPYAILLVVVAYLGVRLAVRFTDALGERFVGRRLLFKQMAAIGRFVVLVLTTLAVFGSVFEVSSDLLTLGGAALATMRYGAGVDGRSWQRSCWEVQSKMRMRGSRVR